MTDKRALQVVRQTTLRRTKAEDAWRDAIRDARGYGCTLREIGEAAGVTHVRVLQLVRE